jgi:hypothetical protein
MKLDDRLVAALDRLDIHTRLLGNLPMVHTEPFKTEWSRRRQLKPLEVPKGS